MLRKRKGYKNFYKLIFTIFIFYLSFTLYDKTFLKRYVDNSLNDISYYFISISDKVVCHIKENSKSIRLNDSLYKENIKLKSEVELLKLSLDNAESKIEEARILRSEFKYYEDQKNYITAKLVSITPGPHQKEALINRGNKFGIEKGDIVLYRRMLLGRIIKVYDNSSIVLLIFDPRSKISAITKNSKKRIVLEGNNSMSLDVKYLLEPEEINDSEFVETSNYCTLFPSDIKIGFMNARNIKKPYGYVPYELKDINYVQIIKNDQMIFSIKENL